VCPCCGFEFGFDDDPGTAEPISIDEYRTGWLASGPEWFDRQRKPDGWDLNEQLSRIGVVIDA
jgi:hypothetical protein